LACRPGAVQNRGVTSARPTTPASDPASTRAADPASAPAADPASWVERDAAVVWHGFTQMATYAEGAPLVIERAEGRELIAADGTRYLDAISSLWVNTLGHRVPELDRALAAQAAKIAHSTMLGNGNTVVVELAEALTAVVPVDEPHFLFAADGAVAVEQALKIAYQYWVNRAGSDIAAGPDTAAPPRTRFLALGDAYHGDTIGSLSLGDGGVFSAVFEPLCFPVLRTPGYVDPGWADKACAMVDAHADELAAVVIEPLVQGASGMLVATTSDLRRLGEACTRAGTLLICDEVATGFGRTGTLFASEQAGLRPDLMCLGKGITGGYLAMSATVASGCVFDAFLGADLGPRTFYHGHSYGGNALAAAVALEHLRLFESWDVLANVRARAEQLAILLKERVAPRTSVRDIRQRGLMVGVELDPPRPGLRWGRRVCAGAVERGVLLRPLGDVVVLMPPLTITEGEIVRMVDALDAALDDVGTGPAPAST
jgi:adenosylmethionine---8-amino-7-oxononanoate aminotransferase